MDCLLVQYMRQRMREKGFAKYHFEAQSLQTRIDQSEYRIPAYNEFYYLASKDLANGTVIHSDTHILKIDQHFSESIIGQVQEFSGLIIIENPERTAQRIDFIRVTPK
ncbi:MAG: hypothetical protein V2A54_13280 [Bacteroidota bacterium]